MNNFRRGTFATLLLVFLLSTAVLSGCAETKAKKQEPPQANLQEQPASDALTPPESPEKTPSASSIQTQNEHANPFDPREMKVGDVVAGMKVTKADILPSTDAEFYVDQANLDLAGEVEVKGTMEFYPQGFEHLDQHVLFTVDPSSSFPRMKVTDDPDSYDKIKLVFDDPNDLKDFRDKPSRGEATLLIREYHLRFPGEDGDETTAIVKKIVSKNMKEATAEELQVVEQN
ncbi:hypothetical protein NDK47_26825 [Brevibacillus ruminantium]|uniref:Lipoprotein n=1 Tax=Brevibacillus ruminantium TaxID=2950604 RepID=A0ABY4WG23_9BACL|nr:hypothetical protein [Brevibacillus ruminantium]USG65669.1 hypothetical protein NDK47_26825 [Brevibacillus ruminantium]